MDQFPFYFFFAGTKNVSTLRDGIWNCRTALPEEFDLLRSVYASDDSEPVVHSEHPCFRDGADRNLWVRSRKIREEAGPDR